MANNIFDLARELPPWLLVGAGVITGGLRAVWSFVYAHTIGYLIARVTISLSVEDNEHRDAYVWLSDWVERHLRGRKVNSLLLRWQDRDSAEGSEAESTFALIPEYGTYYMMHQKRFMMVDHRKEAPQNNNQRPARSIKVQVWFSRDRNRLLEVLREAQTSYEQRKAKRVEYFRPDTYGDWNGSSIPARPVSSLFYPPALIGDLLADVEAFLGSGKMYHDLGIPYRRGYLLTGPPGTGKSSLILAVASQFELPIYALPLHGADLTGERMASMLGGCRKPSLIVVEDIDCFRAATSRMPNAQDGITTADLLNVIDGIGAGEGRLLFMTANHPEALDGALTRAGRVDRNFFVGYARDEELRAFHKRIARYRPVPPWQEFRALLPQQATIADAQALALQERCLTSSR